MKISKMQKEAAEMEASAAVLDAMMSMGGGGSSQSASPRPSGPQSKSWICSQCGNQVRAIVPSSSTKCRAYRGQNDGSCRRNCDWRLLLQ